MLLDGVVHNRGAILMPWREYRREGNSLFRFRLCLGVISIVVLAVMMSVFMLFVLACIRGASSTEGVRLLLESP